MPHESSPWDPLDAPDRPPMTIKHVCWPIWTLKITSPAFQIIRKPIKCHFWTYGTPYPSPLTLGPYKPTPWPPGASFFFGKTRWFYRLKSLIPFSKLIFWKSQFFSTRSYVYLHRYETIATVPESWVRCRAVFQSGSRVLKRCSEPFLIYIYGMQCNCMQKSCWKHSNFENR